MLKVLKFFPNICYGKVVLWSVVIWKRIGNLDRISENPVMVVGKNTGIRLLLEIFTPVSVPTMYIVDLYTCPTREGNFLVSIRTPWNRYVSHKTQYK